MKVHALWHPYRYFPYEKELARRELVALFGKEPRALISGLSVSSQDDGEWRSRARRMTYFREATGEDGTQIIPLQTLLEVSANGEIPHKQDGHAPLRRQSTRYSAHGLHEYRGKFNPQIVRAVGNILGLKPGSWVFDPFCGSGTTLLEAAHSGWNAIGIDLNPLAVLIARAKIAAIQVAARKLNEESELLRRKLQGRLRNVQLDRALSRREIQRLVGEGWQSTIPGFEYLSRWFTESVLAQLAAIAHEIARVPSYRVKLILQVVLSDILRQVSLQDPGDLRIRRRKSASPNYPAIPVYLDALSMRIEKILKARRHLPRMTSQQYVLRGDARECGSILDRSNAGKLPRKFDAAITSPPYATALPYIDTQRLSLVFLGLIEAEEIRTAERQLIGNREITNRERARIEVTLTEGASNLPPSCLSLCRDLKQSLNGHRDGFRRRNVPALLYKYLADMGAMFQQVFRVLKRGAPYALVVGRNQTRLDGKIFFIDTPQLLVKLAEQNGFEIEESIKLNTYQRFDMHQVNSIRSETLIILRKAT